MMSLTVPFDIRLELWSYLCLTVTSLFYLLGLSTVPEISITMIPKDSKRTRLFSSQRRELHFPYTYSANLLSALLLGEVFFTEPNKLVGDQRFTRLCWEIIAFLSLWTEVNKVFLTRRHLTKLRIPTNNHDKWKAVITNFVVFKFRNEGLWMKKESNYT